MNSQLLNKRQLEVLQHALGVDEYAQIPKGHSDYYRNHFCAGGKDEAICRELVGIGYMETFERDFLPYYNCTVTAIGKQAMREQSPKPPKLTRSQKRYRDWMDSGASDCGVSFGVWLKTGKQQKEVA
jgi:hypothetical protein